MMNTDLKALLLDMDGVLWRGDQPIGDLPGSMQRIADQGWQVAYITNNATKRVDQYLDKFARLGVSAQAEQVYTSARATARFLQTQHPGGGALFVVGEVGLQDALTEAGFQIGDQDPLAVVVGLDRQASYDKLTMATLLVRAGASLIGTNPDKTLPSPEGLVPGAGALIAAIEAATDVSATIIGKPQGAMLQLALDDMGIAAEQALMIGDRLETDIAAGQVIGCPTALVLSGVTSQTAANGWRPAPDYITADLASLLKELTNGR